MNEFNKEDRQINRLLTVTQTMELLGVGRTRLYQMLDEKIIPSCRIGYSRRVPEDALQQYIESQLAKENAV